MNTHIATVRDDIDRSKEKVAGDIGDVHLMLNDVKDSLEGQIMELKLLTVAARRADAARARAETASTY